MLSWLFKKLFAVTLDLSKGNVSINRISFTYGNSNT